MGRESRDAACCQQHTPFTNSSAADPGTPPQANIDRGRELAGFAIPKRMWPDALGPAQTALLHECLEVRERASMQSLPAPAMQHAPARAGQAQAPRAPRRAPLEGAAGPEALAPTPCVDQVRYPRTAARAPRAAWRGTNTDPQFDPMDESNALDAARTRLHLMGRWYPELLDAHYTGYSQRAFDTQCVDTLLPPGPRVPLEDFNRCAPAAACLCGACGGRPHSGCAASIAHAAAPADRAYASSTPAPPEHHKPRSAAMPPRRPPRYAFVVDVDGNGWSDRLRLLAHFNTPILKQARAHSHRPCCHAPPRPAQPDPRLARGAAP